MPSEFDEQLQQRLLAFQNHHGLGGNGTADVETWRKLFEGAHNPTGDAGQGGADPAQPDGGAAAGETCGCTVEGGGAAAGVASLDVEDNPELVGVLEEGDEGSDEDDDSADEDEGVGGIAATELQARRGRRRRRPSSVPSQCRANAKACFSVSQRTAWLLRPGRVVVVAVPALGGRRGHETPVGQFSVNFHDEHHVSSTYHAPMPFYVNFADQVGFHAGSLSVLSHGCVHLSRDNAQRFFHYLHDGDPVDVVP
jgi:hypothetical protein